MGIIHGPDPAKMHSPVIVKGNFEKEPHLPIIITVRCLVVDSLVVLLVLNLFLFILLLLLHSMQQPSSRPFGLLLGCAARTAKASTTACYT